MKEWKKTEIEYLKDNYGKKPVKDIAAVLGRTHNSIQRKAQRLELTTSTGDRRPWTEAEITILEKSYEKIGAKRIAKRLNRSEASVKAKVNNLRISCYNGDGISLKLLSDTFEIDSRVIHRWRNKYGLNMKSYMHNKSPMYRLDTEDFWKWAKENKALIPRNRYKKGTLIPEPEWLDDAIHEQVNQNSRKPIKKSEIKFVFEKKNKGYSNIEIAEMCQRSVYSIEHILRVNA